MEDSSYTIKQLSGEWPVYPGHPLVLATAIMSVFENFDAADASTETGCCQALADSRIPGGGDHVAAAMKVLAMGAKGGAVETMIEAAVQYWESGRAGGHAKNVEPGRAQAEIIRPYFETAAQRWFA